MVVRPSVIGVDGGQDGRRSHPSIHRIHSCQRVHLRHSIRPVHPRHPLSTICAVRPREAVANVGGLSHLGGIEHPIPVEIETDFDLDPTIRGHDNQRYPSRCPSVLDALDGIGVVEASAVNPSVPFTPWSDRDGDGPIEAIHAVRSIDEAVHSIEAVHPVRQSVDDLDNEDRRPVARGNSHHPGDGVPDGAEVDEGPTDKDFDDDNDGWCNLLIPSKSEPPETSLDCPRTARFEEQLRDARSRDELEWCPIRTREIIRGLNVVDIPILELVRSFYRAPLEDLIWNGIVLTPNATW